MENGGKNKNVAFIIFIQYITHTKFCLNTLKHCRDVVASCPLLHFHRQIHEIFSRNDLEYRKKKKTFIGS